jgi:hypothetical protein
MRKEVPLLAFSGWLGENRASPSFSDFALAKLKARFFKNYGSPVAGGCNGQSVKTGMARWVRVH